MGAFFCRVKKLLARSADQLDINDLKARRLNYVSR